jgi:trigger factor
MSYTYEKISGNKAKLTFVVPAETFDKALQSAYLKNRGKIMVPGFRKGKAPRKVIETMYGESVFYDDALEAVFPDVYSEAVDAEKLEVVDRPELKSVDQIGEGKDLKFVCEVFVRPDVTLGDYKGLTVEVEKQVVTDADIDARIEEDRKKGARTIDVEDRPVADGDTVGLDYAGTVDGVAFAGGTAEGQTLVIGSHQFIPGFEEQMVGMNIGEEKDLNVKFPEEYHAEDLAGKDAVFHVKVNSISKVEMPELDDDFAADVSEFNTFADYKASIVKELEERAEKNNEISVENALVEKAVANASMDVPEAMINEQLDYMVREMQMRMAYQGLRMEDYLKYTGQTMDQVRGMYRNEAEHRVHIELTLNAIRKAEGVEPTDEDVEKQIAEQAERLNKDVEEFKKTLTDEQRKYLSDTAAIQKVVDLMKADCTVEEKKPEEKTEEAKDAE